MRLSSLAVLFWLNENAGAADTRVPEEVCPQKFIKGVYEELREHNLIVNDDRMAGAVTFSVLPAAAERVEELAGMYRPVAIKRAVLEEVKRNPDQGATAEFGDSINVLGGPVTDPELLSAVKALLGEELITGISTSHTGVHHVLRPELTHAGERALHSSDVEVGGQGAPSHGRGINTYNSVNVSGSTVGAVSAGDQNALTVHQQIAPAIDLPALFAELKPALGNVGLSEADENRYLGQLEAIEEEFEDEQDAERANKGLRRFLKKLPEAVLENLGKVVPAIAMVASAMLGG